MKLPMTILAKLINYLSVSLPPCLSVCQSVPLSLSQLAYLCSWLLICLHPCLPTCLCGCLSACLSSYLSDCLRACLSVWIGITICNATERRFLQKLVFNEKMYLLNSVDGLNQYQCLNVLFTLSELPSISLFLYYIKMHPSIWKKWQLT